MYEYIITFSDLSLDLECASCTKSFASKMIVNKEGKKGREET